MNRPALICSAVIMVKPVELDQTQKAKLRVIFILRSAVQAEVESSTTTALPPPFVQQLLLLLALEAALPQNVQVTSTAWPPRSFFSALLI